MKTLKKLITFAMLALAPTVMFAADHIVFIHGWQWSDGDKERIDTWDRVTNFMANASFGVPFITQDKILVVNYYRGEKDGENRTIEEVARDVKNQIKGGFPDGTCPAKMDFVVHSMGGLVLRTMVKNGDISEDMIDRVDKLAHFWNDSAAHRGIRCNMDRGLYGILRIRIIKSTLAKFYVLLGLTMERLMNGLLHWMDVLMYDM